MFVIITCVVVLMRFLIKIGVIFGECARVKACQRVYPVGLYRSSYVNQCYQPTTVVAYYDSL